MTLTLPSPILHSSVPTEKLRIATDDREGQTALAEYIMRNAFSEQKITYIEDTGKVLCRSVMTHGKNKKNFEIFSAEEFIAAITQHIPDKSFQMVRYYGWYEMCVKCGVTHYDMEPDRYVDFTRRKGPAWSQSRSIPRALKVRFSTLLLFAAAQ